MDSTIIVAVLSVIGTFIGSALGALGTAKMTSFRLSRLEEKVDKHNHVIERMAIAENTLKSHQHQLDEIKDEIERG